MDYRLLCLLALAGWGTWGYLSKLGMRATPPAGFAFWSAVAGIVPIATFVALAASRSGLKPAPPALLAGLCAGAASVAFYLALNRGPASVVLPLTGMYIMVPALLGIVFLREQVTLTKVLGLVSAGLAVLLLSR